MLIMLIGFLLLIYMSNVNYVSNFNINNGNLMN